MITDSTPAPATEYTILDRVRQVKFSGWLLGEASTQQQSSERWTEIKIYRTAGGTYVVQRLGLSRVYHRDPGCERGEVVTNDQILDGSVPCSVCRPPSVAALDEMDDDPSTYRREVTMSSVERTTDPHQVIRILTYKGRLTTVSTEAINQAIKSDPGLAGIFDQAEVID